MRALEILSANLRRLAQQPGHPSSGPGVESAAKAMGLSIGRSSVGRYFIASGNPSLEHVETLAKVFGVQPWQLLHPTLGAGIAVASVADSKQFAARTPTHFSLVESAE